MNKRTYGIVLIVVAIIAFFAGLFDVFCITLLMGIAVITARREELEWEYWE